jgi:hypothetical protein
MNTLYYGDNVKILRDYTKEEFITIYGNCDNNNLRDWLLSHCI